MSTRGWATAPVIGTGTEDDPYRPSVADREGVEGDRLEFVIDAEKSDTCLVGYDVADDSDFAKLGGEKLLAEADLDKAANRVAEASKLDALAQESKVGRAGSAREVLRRIGQTISPTFDERLHLGDGEAPPTGSFVVDTFPGSEGTTLQAHTPDSGGPMVKHSTASGDGYVDGSGGAYSDASYALYYYTEDPASAEYDVASTIRMWSTGLFGRASLAGRLSTSADTGYFSQYNEHDEAAYLIKTVAGSDTSLGSYSMLIGSGSEEDSLLELRDATKKAYYGGVERISSSDNAITAKGKAGLVIEYSGSNWGVHLKDFTATDAGGEEEPEAPDPIWDGEKEVSTSLAIWDGSKEVAAAWAVST